MSPAPKHTRRWFARVGLLACAVFIVGVLGVRAYRFVDQMVHGAERRIRQHTQSQIADVVAGKSHLIVVQGQGGVGFAADEFSNHVDSLNGAGPFTLRVVRCGHTAELLKSACQLRGLRRLELGTNDVTDTAMEYVATLPDLEELVLYELNVSDQGLEKLRASPKLETLYLAPRSNGDVSVPAIISLPKLRRLTVEETFPDHWLESSLEEFASATSLKELTIVAITLYQEKIDSLKASLPDCIIETRDWKDAEVKKIRDELAGYN